MKAPIFRALLKESSPSLDRAWALLKMSSPNLGWDPSLLIWFLWNLVEKRADSWQKEQYLYINAYNKKLFIMVNCWLMSFYIYIDAYFRLLKDCYLVKFQRAWPYFWGVWPRFHQHFITCTVIKVNIKFIRITLFWKNKTLFLLNAHVYQQSLIIFY